MADVPRPIPGKLTKESLSDPRSQNVRPVRLFLVVYVVHFPVVIVHAAGRTLGPPA